MSTPTGLPASEGEQTTQQPVSLRYPISTSDRDASSELSTPEPVSAAIGVGAQSRRVKIILLALAALSVGAWAYFQSGTGRSGLQQESLLLHSVRQEPLSVTVVERGNLESQSVIPVMCEVDDYRRDGFNGTAIIWVIPNGSLVEAGDLLVELDEAPIREQMDEQILDTEQARELMLLATARLENQTSQNETDLAEAELKIKLAKLNVEMYTDEESGTHRLEVESLKREIEDINNEILSAQANLELKRNDKEGIETLFKLGYAGKSEFDRSQLDFLQAENLYASKFNRLRTQLATLNKKETYERQMQMLELQGKLDTAERAKAQVLKNNAALVTQLKASLAARTEQFEKEQELLDRYKEQHRLCKIYAPAAGMVAYTESRYGEAAPGQYFRIRQQILSLPNLKQMQVKTAVHESVLDKVKPGQEVSVRVESFSDRRYQGVVDSLAVLPQSTRSSLASDTRFYETVIKINGEVSQLKPGMTAVVEIDVAHQDNALSVPVQAVVSQKKQTYCYVSRDGNVERVPVKLGIANEHQVQVVSGISVGDQVVLNPMSLHIDASTNSSEDAGRPAETSESVAQR